MAVLTVITNLNGYTVRLKEPPRNEKYQHIRPVSCSFFNTWYNLSRPGEVSIINAQGTPTKKKILEGNYSLKSLGQAL